MAKRRKLEAPSAEDLNRIEADLDRGTVRGPLSAPIAQVAAESAASHDPRPAEARAAQARDRADAERLREAEAQGLLLLDVPIEEIALDAMVRDRMVLDSQEFDELKLSIAKTGLRLPVEIFDRGEGESPRYGLLSGYRRLKAFQDLKALTRQEKYDRIRAILREPEQMGGSFAAMVEENEIRASLSHFERGRIAVLAAQQGAFVNPEEAVNALFPMASKAKRSKIRSFALIFEELGDMLTFPDRLREKDGLELAAALRSGHEARLRDILSEQVPETPAEEAEILAAALAELSAPPPDRSRGGRPKARKRSRAAHDLGDLRIEAVEDKAGAWSIRLTGARADARLVDDVVGELVRLLARS